MKHKNFNTLFLDRDGVINTRLIDNYVSSWSEFEFIEGVLEAIKIFSNKFQTIIIVTNQQGIGKGIMSQDELETIHRKMVQEIHAHGGRIDKIYSCNSLEKDRDINRKPSIGMGLKARKDFKNLRFKKSIMVGDSISDMRFGKRLKMRTVFISNSFEKPRQYPKLIDQKANTLLDFAKTL